MYVKHINKKHIKSIKMENGVANALSKPIHIVGFVYCASLD